MDNGKDMQQGSVSGASDNKGRRDKRVSWASSVTPSKVPATSTNSPTGASATDSPANSASPAASGSARKASVPGDAAPTTPLAVAYKAASKFKVEATGVGSRYSLPPLVQPHWLATPLV